jgi:hypothetical protein
VSKIEVIEEEAGRTAGEENTLNLRLVAQLFDSSEESVRRRQNPPKNK